MQWIDTITPQPSPVMQAATRVQKEQEEHERLTASAAQMVSLLRDGLARAGRTPQLINPYYQNSLPPKLADLTGWSLPWGRIWLLNNGQFVRFTKVDHRFSRTWGMVKVAPEEALICFFREGTRLFLRNGVIHYESTTHSHGDVLTETGPVADALLEWVNAQH